MHEEPLVSIIIPTYNRAHLIGETLDSIIAQTYSNWECIVVDDGSTDTTVDLLATYCKKDARFQFHHRPFDRPNGGNAARNYGFKLSRGEYIQWFDSDDLMSEELLKKQVLSTKKNNKKITVCLFDRYNEDFSKLQKAAVNNELHYNAFYDFITANIRMNLQSTLWNKSLLLDFKLNENLKKAQEYNFIQRVLKLHYEEIVLLNESLVHTRNHSESITGSFFKAEDNQKIKDSLEVKWEVLKNLSTDAPKQVKDDLIKLYFKALYKVFKFKKTSILFNYLFNLSKLKDLQITKKVIKVSLVYMVYFFTNKGENYYKNIVKNE